MAILVVMMMVVGMVLVLVLVLVMIMPALACRMRLAVLRAARPEDEVVARARLDLVRPVAVLAQVEDRPADRVLELELLRVRGGVVQQAAEEQRAALELPAQAHVQRHLGVVKVKIQFCVFPDLVLYLYLTLLVNLLLGNVARFMRTMNPWCESSEPPPNCG